MDSRICVAGGSLYTRAHIGEASWLYFVRCFKSTWCFITWTLICRKKKRVIQSYKAYSCDESSNNSEQNIKCLFIMKSQFVQFAWNGILLLYSLKKLMKIYDMILWFSYCNHIDKELMFIYVPRCVSKREPIRQYRTLH